MSRRLGRPAVRLGLETLYFSGTHVLMRPFVGGVGAILTLHHVRPPRLDRFRPNRHLEATPAFLEDLLRHLRRARFDFVSLDEMHRRLMYGEFQRRFVCVTFDDGYRDTLQYAYPILKKHEAPFALYLATSFPDRIGELWWLVLEAVIARNERIGLLIDGEERRFDCRWAGDKRHLFAELYGWLRSLPTERELRLAVRDLAVRYKVDIASFCEELCLSWEEIGRLAEDPLVTIGAHTVNHVILSKASDKTLRSEMQMSRAVIEAAIGQQPRHFAYPFGDKSAAGAREMRAASELGFTTAVTARPGVLFQEHRDNLFALPRLALNGSLQQLRYAKVMLSGAPTALMHGFRRVDAA